VGWVLKFSEIRFKFMNYYSMGNIQRSLSVSDRKVHAYWRNRGIVPSLAPNTQCHMSRITEALSYQRAINKGHVGVLKASGRWTRAIGRGRMGASFGAITQVYW
jgi:hypothetical protein